ncbi:MAG: response regulator, partial [Acidimicrobiales bacterium]
MSQHAGTPDPGGEIVVVIDDELSVRELLCTVLELDGYQVYVALNGPLGLGLIDAMRPAVVVLDVMMPGMNGVDVCYLIDHE